MHARGRACAYLYSCAHVYIRVRVLTERGTHNIAFFQQLNILEETKTLNHSINIILHPAIQLDSRII